VDGGGKIHLPRTVARVLRSSGRAEEAPLLVRSVVSSFTIKIRLL
jgi:hypothetical protein